MSNILRKLRSGSPSQENSKPEEQMPNIRQPYAPKPLSPKRKRALTLPLAQSNPGSKARQWTSDQAHCAFLRVLPYDVRRLIYKFVLAGRTFHIIRLRRRLRHVECTRHGRPSRDNSTCWGNPTVDGRDVHKLETEGFDQDLLDLLRTCRQIYTECIDILYSQTIFDISRPESLISFSATLLPQRFDSISSLQLTWSFFCNKSSDPERPLLRGDNSLWKACWQIIATMKELKNIRVWLAMYPANEMSPHHETNLLMPLAQIGAKRLFEVRVSWSLEGDSDKVEAATTHYRLVRQEREDWGARALRLRHD